MIGNAATVLAHVGRATRRAAGSRPVAVAVLVGTVLFLFGIMWGSE